MNRIVKHVLIYHLTLPCLNIKLARGRIHSPRVHSFFSNNQYVVLVETAVNASQGSNQRPLGQKFFSYYDTEGFAIKNGS